MSHKKIWLIKCDTKNKNINARFSLIFCSVNFSIKKNPLTFISYVTLYRFKKDFNITHLPTLVCPKLRIQPSAPASTHCSTSHKLFSQTSAWKIILQLVFCSLFLWQNCFIICHLYINYMNNLRTFHMESVSWDVELFIQMCIRISRYWISALKWPNLRVLQMFLYYESDGLQTIDRSAFTS